MSEQQRAGIALNSLVCSLKLAVARIAEITDPAVVADLIGAEAGARDALRIAESADRRWKSRKRLRHLN